jgi:DNA-3-methyladenine glycosylase
MLLGRDFFIRDTVEVAKDLLWKIIKKWSYTWIIIETEAYTWSDDPASHAFRWKTNRNYPMFDIWWKSYVYFIYGMYYCFNVTTNKKWIPWAVLIRWVYPIHWIEQMMKNRNVMNIKNLTNWPWKFTQAFEITKIHNNIDLTNHKSEIKILDNEFDWEIISTKRIWINKWNDKNWRFLLKNYF